MIDTLVEKVNENADRIFFKAYIRLIGVLSLKCVTEEMASSPADLYELYTNLGGRLGLLK